MPHIKYNTVIFDGHEPFILYTTKIKVLKAENTIKIIINNNNVFQIKPKSQRSVRLFS